MEIQELRVSVCLLRTVAGRSGEQVDWGPREGFGISAVCLCCGGGCGARKGVERLMACSAAYGHQVAPNPRWPHLPGGLRRARGRCVMGANLTPVHALTGVMSSLEAFRVQEGMLCE